MIPFILASWHVLSDCERLENFFDRDYFVATALPLWFILNSPPVEPRERDYIMQGSYYAFAMWIGLAVVGIADAILVG